ncbi:hypothetical protein CBI30_06915 [Polynucleobacter aenigmaticus]|uniref:Uncharacterized protein n=1 Tax=Polynucleobacter aenigmaticus TaxID=1743164 RepID=A0A254PY46_9BURK|nr:hypothetical protein [Polynucleobacter aenigmaticus]OWS71465.1 hypothetical protein CBI30_06915 [Polynucleobacter aenigmaticus]
MKLVLSKLNGWQRIFVAFIIFIYLPISAIFMSDKPYITGLTEKQFLELMPTDILLEMKAGKAFYMDKDNKKPWDEYVEPNKFVMIDYDFAYSWRYTLAIDKKVDPTKAVAMGEQLGKALYDDYSKKLLMARLKNVAMLIGFAVAIYAFGWTLGWIYKGFKKPI